MNENTAAKHAALTAAIIADLERGVAPWVRPWTTTGLSDLPSNIVSKRPYHGANVLALWMRQTALAYPTAEWVTFKQARDLGGCVRKGEHGSPIFFVSAFEREGDNGETKRIPFLKSYTVFNVAQVDGLPLRTIPEPRPEAARLEDVETFLRDVGATVRHGGDAAYYSPGLDLIVLPERDAFADAASYYGTALHEHAHWTGAKPRLDRTFGKRFGDNAYAFEELVAELSAAFLCAALAIPGRLQHPEYIGHWATILGGDNQAIWTAGARATDAVAFLHRAAGRAEDVDYEEKAA